MSKFTEARGWYRRVSLDDYQTVKPLPWEIGAKGSNLWLTAPIGFRFDVSVPWFLRWCLNPHDARFLKAAALHDYALSLGWDRVSAAAAFSEALRADGVARTTRLLMVAAVITWNWN